MPSQYKLGVMYDNSQGVPKDEAQAAKWYRLAADRGDARAQNNSPDGLFLRIGQRTNATQEVVSWLTQGIEIFS